MSRKDYVRAWHEANKERRNAAARERYRANREAILQRQAEYKAANREKVVASRRSYYVTHADAIKEKSKRYYEKQRERKLALFAEYRARPEWRAEQAARRRRWKEGHRSQVVEYEAMRRARKNGVAAEVVERAVLWERDLGACHICGTLADPADWHVEHIVPLSRGGEHTYSNTAVSHPECNMLKGDSDPREVDSPYEYLLDRQRVS